MRKRTRWGDRGTECWLLGRARTSRRTRVLDRQDLVMRLEYSAGERMFLISLRARCRTACRREVNIALMPAWPKGRSSGARVRLRATKVFGLSLAAEMSACC